MIWDMGCVCGIMAGVSSCLGVSVMWDNARPESQWPRRGSSSSVFLSWLSRKVTQSTYNTLYFSPNRVIYNEKNDTTDIHETTIKRTLPFDYQGFSRQIQDNNPVMLLVLFKALFRDLQGLYF